MTSLNPGSSRRLTGPNRWTLEPAVIVEARWQGELSESILQEHFALWTSLVEQVAVHLGWPSPRCQVHRELEAIMMTFISPLDGLYTGCEIAEDALETCCRAFQQQSSVTFSTRKLAHYSQEYAKEQNPALLALQAAAAQHGVPFLWDDDECSLGFGQYAQVWDVRSLPEGDALEALDWESFRSIPAAFITGTNGKTTTSRMLTRILRKDGKCVGSTSTDGLCLNEEMLETGDWTGPGGARTILRHNEVDVAILETARGGLLRRGLATNEAGVAILTNVSDDHLGEWGIETIPQMAEVKFLIRHGLKAGGILLLNADSKPVVDVCRHWVSQWTEEPPFQIGWWSTRPDEQDLETLLPFGELLAWVEPVEQELCFLHEQDIVSLSVSRVPMTLHGLAEHNVSNALSAGLAALQMGCSWEAVKEGLCSFAPSVQDNPGRANLFTCNGARVVVDFGHNPDGVCMMAKMAARLQPSRTLVLLGQAGDRSDEAIQDLATATMPATPDLVLLKHMKDYLRGRPAGEIQDLMEQRFLEEGQPAQTIVRANSERAAIATALEWAQEGDLLLLFVQASFRKAVQQLFEAGATEGWPS